MELPREVQVYIYTFLYDKWRLKWSEVMKEVLKIEIKSRMLRMSGLLHKRWNSLEIRICLDCGDYYRIPMYSCHKVCCGCD